MRPLTQFVVIDTTKVRLFKQITTAVGSIVGGLLVVIDTTKVRLFKQITTFMEQRLDKLMLLLIPQR